MNSSAVQALSEMREAFAMYDADGGGTLDVGEIHDAMVELGQDLTQEQAQVQTN